MTRIFEACARIPESVRPNLRYRKEYFENSQVSAELPFEFAQVVCSTLYLGALLARPEFFVLSSDRRILDKLFTFHLTKFRSQNAPSVTGTGKSFAGISEYLNEATC